MTQAESVLHFFSVITPGEILSLRALYELLPTILGPSVRRTVYGLIDEGKLKRVGRGLYRLAEPEEEEWMWRQTVAVRCVMHGSYVNIVAHYYGATPEEAGESVPVLMGHILERAVLVTGYHNSQVDDFLISDAAKLPFEGWLVGTTEVEQEWEL